ncbi:MAG TPA: alpha/beta hydrolase domain-containing protein, partial [Asticcacaulis sp.]|nr:alpha/beta hydrolase domain-containing protein [Asticcacaulis sp.]
SQVPKLSDHTLVPPLPQADMGFPNIPGVTYTGLKTTRYHFNYGPDFDKTGVPTINPPTDGAIYPSFIPRTDVDGNDIAGIRLPRVSVPLATYTGWALRAGAWGNDGCEGSGQFIPFAKTKAERQASGDPRLSAAERYGSFDGYARAVDQAVKKMISGRTLLPADAQTVTRDALDLGRMMLP